MAAAALVWEFWAVVMGEDLSDWETISIFGGPDFPIQKAEALVYWHLANGRRFMLAEVNGKTVGMVVYDQLFAGIIAIRAEYTQPEVEKLGIAKQMVNAIQPEVKKIIFQTNNKKPPERLLELTKKHRINMGGEGNFSTWMMDWRR